MANLCRDCFAVSVRAADADSRCGQCGSPRLVSHPDLFDLRVAHLDCDSFYASVEKRDAPELRLQPVVIGGGRRGVVAAACYMARQYGIHSAMPMFKARAACPHAKVIRPNMGKYKAVGTEVRALMRQVTPVIEPISIDEAFLDFSSLGEMKEPPALALARLAARVEALLGVTVSIGLAPNKFLAKIASDLDKPRGFAVISARDAAAFLRPKPVGMIHGVGQATRQRMAADGVERIGQLRALPPAELARRYGSFGESLAYYSRGIDRRRVRASRPTKTISGETTFEDPIRSPVDLSRRLSPLAKRVADRMQVSGYLGATVTLKLKTAGFQTLTRSHTLADPTDRLETIEATAQTLLKREAGETAYRLIGVSVANLSRASADEEPDLLSLGPGTGPIG